MVAQSYTDMQSIRFKFVSAIAALTLGAVAHAQFFGQATGFNLYTSGDLTSSNSDIEGRAAAGGNANFSSFSVNSNNVPGGGLFVKGNLTFTNGSINGDAYVGGTPSLTGVGFGGGGSLHATNPAIDFVTTKSFLQGLSGSLKSIGNTGTVTKPFSTLLLTGASSSLNVFTVSSADLAAASDINIIVPVASTVLVNVTGTSMNLPNFGYNINGSQSAGAFAKVLWNMKDVTSLGIVGSFNGSILAPDANVVTNYGQMNGQLIVNSFDGHLEMHQHPFEGQIDSVPEPASMAVLGLAALAIKRRKRAS